MANSGLKVLIADDSVFMRMLISDILQEDTEIKVVAQAKDGKEALAMCREHQPDVVLLDMTMGAFDGLYGVAKIMEECPTPIVILSAMGNTDMEPIMKALALGAVDYLNKPAKNNSNLRDVGQFLIEKVKEASLIKPKKLATEVPLKNTNPHSFDSNLEYDVIVIAASTGGPTAVEQVITQLPGNLAIPVLIVQHMPPNFVPSFANRLDALTPLEVTMAKKDDVVEKGKILIAPGSRNTIIRREGDKVVIDFTSKTFSEYNHPSASCLMSSVASVYGKKSIGIILTGMGRDGTEGMTAISNAGGYTIAQSAETCVVNGMPKSAIDAGCIRQVVPLNEIGGFVVSCLS